MKPGHGSVEHRIQLVCQVVKHAADVVQDGDCSLFAGEGDGDVNEANAPQSKRNGGECKLLSWFAF